MGQLAQSQVNLANETRQSIKNLENQVGQLAKQLSERPPGELPSDTEVPHIEHCKMISLRSGRNVNAQKTEGVVSESELEKEKKKIREEERKKIYDEEREKIREEIREEIRKEAREGRKKEVAEKEKEKRMEGEKNE